MTVNSESSDHTARVGEEALRQVLGRYPTGVMVVSGLGPDGPAGLCVNSFTSVSLSPPLVSFCVAHTSSTWPRLRIGPGLCFTILDDRQQPTAARFAGPGDRFNATTWRPSPAGLPIIDGGVGWLECVIAGEHRAGDHDIVICRVCRVSHSPETDGTDRSGPLLRYHGAYGRFTAEG